MAEVPSEVAAAGKQLFKVKEDVSEGVSITGLLPKEEYSCPIHVGENSAKEVENLPRVLSLPVGWVEVTHNSGATVYLHAATRVCTWSRPYTVPPTKKIKQHGTPLASIPCLHQFVKNGCKKEEENCTTNALVQQWLHRAGGKKERLTRLNLAQFRNYLDLQFTFAASIARVTATTTSTPAVASSVPVASSSVPVATSSVPVSANSVPVGASSVSVASSSVPVATSSVPVATSSVPVATSSVPVATSSVPVAASSIPVSASSVPVATSCVSIAASSIPVVTSSVPIGASSVPVASSSVPVAASSIPVVTSSVPIGASSVPVAASSVPVATSSVPIGASSIPVATSSVPIGASSVPVAFSSIPVAASSVPIGASSVPVAASSVPAVSSVFTAVVKREPFSSTQSTLAEPNVQPHVQRSGLILADSTAFNTPVSGAGTSSIQSPPQYKVQAKSDANKVLVLPDSLKNCIARISKKKAPAVLMIKGVNNSDLTVLYRLAQAHLGVKLEVESSELCDGNYQSQVFIDDIFHGAAMGCSKREAKHKAGSHVLGLFMEYPVTEHHKGDRREEQTATIELDKFKGIPLWSPDVASLLSRHSLPSPWVILNQCVSKSEAHLGGNGKLVFVETPVEESLVKFVLTLGEGRRVEGVCKHPGGSRDQAAQLMFEKLYPFLSDWRAILRVYQDIVTEPRKSLKRNAQMDVPLAKKPKNSISNPDTTLLDKLKTEMSLLATSPQSHGSPDDFHSKVLPAFRL